MHSLGARFASQSKRLITLFMHLPSDFLFCIHSHPSNLIICVSRSSKRRVEGRMNKLGRLSRAVPGRSASRYVRDGGVTRCTRRGSLLIQTSHHQPFKTTSLHLLPRQQLRSYSDKKKKKFTFNANPATSFLEFVGQRRREYQEAQSTTMSSFYLDGTPDEVKNAKGLHLLTMNTPNGQGTLWQYTNESHQNGLTVDYNYSCVTQLSKSSSRN